MQFLMVQMPQPTFLRRKTKVQFWNLKTVSYTAHFQMILPNFRQETIIILKKNFHFSATRILQSLQKGSGNLYNQIWGFQAMGSNEENQLLAIAQNTLSIIKVPPAPLVALIYFSNACKCSNMTNQYPSHPPRTFAFLYFMKQINTCS